MNKFFQIASLFLQVPVLAVVLIIALVWFGVVRQQEGMWVIVALIHLSFLPLFYGAFVYKTKRISDSEITERKERLVPFLIITLIYGVYLLETIFFDAPLIFKTLAIQYFMLALFLSTITIVWKASVHAAGITQFIALLVLLIGSQALVLTPLMVFVGWLRIKMKSHDIWQVLGGIVVALVSVLIATKISPL